MKVLHITQYYEPHLGGVETHVKKISQELIKQGHEVTVLTQLHSIALPLEDKKDGVKIVRINTESKVINPFNYKLTIWQQMARQAQLLLKADVIHVHDVYWWLLPLLPLFWSKTFLTFHGWEGKFPVLLKSKLARWVWSKLALRTIHVGRYIQDFYWDKPDLIVYGGVYSKKKITPKKIDKKVKIVFIGRLEAENDLDKYLALAEKLKSKFNLEIIWVGDGEYRSACEQYGQVTGMVKDTGKYLANANLVWSASYLSILEAQARGKIVCALYENSLKESYLSSYPGSAQMLIEYDVDKMSSQIEKLIKNKKVFREYSLQAHQQSLQHSWEKVANQYQHLWRGK